MSLLRRGPQGLATVASRYYHGRALIGKREVVGYGMNGEYAYHDRTDFPYPAIRWAEPDSKIETLLQKEKGDWKNLSLDEKKQLYRYSYRLTFAEMNAPDGLWKLALGGSLALFGCAFWMFAFLKAYVYPPLPASCSEESKKAQMERMIALRMNPISGVASKWDYEKNCWK